VVRIGFTEKPLLSSHKAGLHGGICPFAFIFMINLALFANKTDSSRRIRFSTSIANKFLSMHLIFMNGKTVQIFSEKQ
jgi:hypothetical protein